MENLVKVRRGNVVLKVPEHQVQRYLHQGFDAYDKNGNLIKRVVTNDLATLQAEQVKSDKIIKDLQNQVRMLQAQPAMTSSKEEELKKQNDDLYEQVSNLKAQIRDLKKRLKEAEKRLSVYEE